MKIIMRFMNKFQNPEIQKSQDPKISKCL